MASWRPLPGLAGSRRASTVNLVQLSCRRYQPRRVSTTPPWRVARRRSGSRMVVGVRGGCFGSGGARQGGLLRSCASTSMYGWPWAGLVGLGDARWPRGREVGPGVSWVLVARVFCVFGEVSVSGLRHAPLIVASLTRGSLKRCSVAWCAWLWVGQPSCCCRVSAGDQPTSVHLSVWRGHILECSQSSGVVWSHGQWVFSSGTKMCLRASHRATVVRSGSCSLRH